MPIADTSVRTYLSTMTGAPTLSGTAGTLITLLDNCLINGFGSVTLSSLVVASNVATATVNTGHGFSMIAGGLLGPVIRIAGATPSTLNRDWRIASAPNSTTFTFVTADLSDQTATGTITAKIAPADWTKPYSGTNKAAYARSDADATAMLLRVDDTATTSATAIMYEAMTGIDTGTGPAPTSGSVYCYKSASANGTAREWRLIADARMLYFFARAGGTYYDGGLVFGDILSYKPGDAYHCLLAGGQSNATHIGWFASFQADTVANVFLAREQSQLGGAIACRRNSRSPLRWMGDSSYIYTSGTTNPVDNRVHVWPVSCQDDNTGAIRGELPGVLCPVTSTPDAAGWLSDDNRVLLGQGIYDASRRAAILLEGPWR